jgi:hypothetical protein
MVSAKSTCYTALEGKIDDIFATAAVAIDHFSALDEKGGWLWEKSRKYCT